MLCWLIALLQFLAHDVLLNDVQAAMKNTNNFDLLVQCLSMMRDPHLMPQMYLSCLAEDLVSKDTDTASALQRRMGNDPALMIPTVFTRLAAMPDLNYLADPLAQITLESTSDVQLIGRDIIRKHEGRRFQKFFFARLTGPELPKQFDLEYNHSVGQSQQKTRAVAFLMYIQTPSGHWACIRKCNDTYILCSDQSIQTLTPADLAKFATESKVPNYDTVCLMQGILFHTEDQPRQEEGARPGNVAAIRQAFQTPRKRLNSAINAINLSKLCKALAAINSTATTTFSQKIPNLSLDNGVFQ